MQCLFVAVRGEHARVHANSLRHCGCIRIKGDNWRSPGTQSMCAWPLVDCHTRRWKGSVPRATFGPRLFSHHFLHCTVRVPWAEVRDGVRTTSCTDLHLKPPATMAGLFMAHQPLPVPHFRVHHHVRTLNNSYRSSLLDRAFVPASCQVSRVCLMGVCVWPAVTRATVVCSGAKVVGLHPCNALSTYPMHRTRVAMVLSSVVLNRVIDAVRFVWPWWVGEVVSTHNLCNGRERERACVCVCGGVR
jgi:hypothetical protein